MTLKAKLVSTIAAFALVLALLVVGVLAASSASINMSGSLSFTATDVNATVDISVAGNTAAGDVGDGTYTFNSATQDASKDVTLSDLDWVFASKTSTITLTIVVTNNDSARSLTSTLTPTLTELADANVTASAQATAGVTGTVGQAQTLEAGESVTYTVTFKITDANKSVSSTAATWSAKLALANAG